MEKFICDVVVNGNNYVVGVFADSAILAEHKILDMVVQYKGERRVGCTAYEISDKTENIVCDLIWSGETIDLDGIKRVIIDYCNECEMQERAKENTDKVTKICELLNGLGDTNDLETLQKNSKIFDAMIKELKG